MKFPARLLLLCVVALACFTTPVFANSIPVQNFSFETANPLIYSSPGAGVWNTGPIPGWTITGGTAGSWQPGSASFTAPVPDGSLVAYTNGGTISQDLGISLAAQTTYLLTVAVGNRLEAGLTTSYTIALYAGGVLLNALTSSNNLIPIGTFADQTVSFTSGVTLPSGNLTIVLSSLGPQAVFDNVRLTATTVAEPASLTLLAAGLAFAFFLLRRR